ncbi:hypothetical protein CHARACLAT_027227, partial [Characodon lateralis]|nr:hypothetical protein [Characodon lateralis]
GRSRGRAQVEDEESRGNTVQSQPQKKTEPKVPTALKEVKPMGRRRSTTRTKSNTSPEQDPEPRQARLSPRPEADPESTVPEFSSKLAPCSEDENRTSPTLAALFTEHILEESPQVCPPSPDYRPDPDLGEEGQPSLSYNPVPMESGCGPSRVTTDTEEGCGISPMEQNPVMGPCSSPPVSLGLQLEDEDEDSLSPLFQHSPSEDSGGSPTPSLGHTKKRLKQCAFCYRGDQPPLGQGRLVVFGPTPGYIPLHILNRRTSSDCDDDCHDHCYRSNLALPMCSSPAQCEDKSSSEFIKQLGPIGLPHDINVQSLFDPTGTPAS